MLDEAGQVLLEQVGVKAPGSPNITTLRFSNRSGGRYRHCVADAVDDGDVHVGQGLAGVDVVMAFI